MSSNTEIAIVTHGSGPLPVVIIHGWAMNSGLMEATAQALSDIATVYCVDLPGHGRSRDCDLPLDPDGAVTAQLGERIGPDALWIGWSMGGLFALAAAQRSQARGLVMLSSTPSFAEREGWPHGLRPSVLTGMRQAVATDARRTVTDFLRLEVLGVTRAHPALQDLEQLAFGHGMPQAHALEQGLDLLEHCDMRAPVSRLNVPQLWIGGARDRLVSPDTLTAAAAMAARGESHILAGAGHAAFLSTPDRFNSALRNWIDGNVRI